ncbi:MAG: ACP S-malonyltransferase [Woeseia sp.]|nr:ACP S-malonyltransferase [Woeseia sp.]
MVFPGQGSQSLGMQSSLASSFPEVAATYAEASDILGFDLWEITQSGPQEELDKTVVTQPAMLAAGVATWRCWQAAGGKTPAWLAGHSLGEYSALVAAEAINFADAVRVVQQRATLMQDAVPSEKSGMAAILGLDDDAVIAACSGAEEGQVVRAVNFNSPGQVVIAGDCDAVTRAVELAKAAGAKRAMMLRVSVPSHSPLMKPAAEALSGYLDATTFAIPTIGVISNVDVQPYVEPQQIRAGLYRQVFNPVQWTKTIRRFIDEGVDTVIECGPGKVLAGLTRRIDRSINCVAIEDPEALQKALETSRSSTST